MVQTMKIKNDAGHQAIPIPDNFKLDGEEVYIKKIGNALYIIPISKPWQNLFDSLDSFTPDFMETRNEGQPQEREPLDS